MSKKFILAVCVSLLNCINCYGCTGIIQKAENNEWVFARTMEFGADIISFDILFVPRGYEQKSETQTDKNGLQWKTKYAYVGFSPYGLPVLADGINEKGLACGAFYLPDLAKYQNASPAESSKTLANIYLVSWVLANFTTVKEVRDAIQQIKVVGVNFKGWGFVPPLHYMVVDESGDRVVIEYTDGQLHLFDGRVGSITNSPSYDWQVTNLRNYIGLSSHNIPSLKIDGVEISGFGQGTGGLGLPGDFTPPSRFVRATYFNQFVLPGKTGLDQVFIAFKILNQFDIPKGAIKDSYKGKDLYDVTVWTSASDLSARRYFFHTADNRVLQSIDLKAINLDGKDLKKMNINSKETVVDVTSDLVKQI